MKSFLPQVAESFFNTQKTDEKIILKEFLLKSLKLLDNFLKWDFLGSKNRFTFMWRNDPSSTGYLLNLSEKWRTIIFSNDLFFLKFITQVKNFYLF